MAQEAVRWTVYGIVVVTVFIVSMILQIPALTWFGDREKKPAQQKTYVLY